MKADDLTRTAAQHQPQAEAFATSDRFVSRPRSLTTPAKPFNPYAVLTGPEREDE